ETHAHVTDSTLPGARADRVASVGAPGLDRAALARARRVRLDVRDADDARAAVARAARADAGRRRGGAVARRVPDARRRAHRALGARAGGARRSRRGVRAAAARAAGVVRGRRLLALGVDRAAPLHGAQATARRRGAPAASPR